MSPDEDRPPGEEPADHEETRREFYRLSDHVVEDVGPAAKELLGRVLRGQGLHLP